MKVQFLTADEAAAMIEDDVRFTPPWSAGSSIPAIHAI